VEQGKAVERRVTTGRRVGDRVEIVSGLKTGERVVSTPGTLQQGQAVRVRSGA
jgi:multidrug efflux pump subunit AcrA (membrane-fusion protein)